MFNVASCGPGRDPASGPGCASMHCFFPDGLDCGIYFFRFIHDYKSVMRRQIKNKTELPHI